MLPTGYTKDPAPEARVLLSQRRSWVAEETALPGILKNVSEILLEERIYR